MALNLVIPQKQTGDTRLATEDNQITDWGVAPLQTLGAFDPAMTFESQGEYDDYTAVGDITFTATGIQKGNTRWVKITTDGTHTFSFGSGCTTYDGLSIGQLTAGVYKFGLASLFDKVQIIYKEYTAPVQLTALTLGTASVGNGEITVPFTNPNSSNEDQNQLYYKLATEPTTWTTGVTAVTGATTFPAQTGLTNDLEYDFKGVAEGSGSYTGSSDSNEISATPTDVTIYLSEDYDGTTIDTDVSDVTNTNPSSVVISQNDGLFLTPQGIANTDYAEDNVTTDDSHAGDQTISFDLKVPSQSNTSVWSCGLWKDALNTDRIYFIRDETAGTITFGARINSINDLVSVDYSLSLATTKRMKIVLAGNDITFYYLNASWVEMGTVNVSNSVSWKSFTAQGDNTSGTNVNIQINRLRWTDKDDDAIHKI